MKAASRLKRITKVMAEKDLSEHPWRYIVCNFNESEEEAIARSSYDPSDKNVFIVKYRDEASWPLQKNRPVSHNKGLRKVQKDELVVAHPEDGLSNVEPMKTELKEAEEIHHNPDTPEKKKPVVIVPGEPALRKAQPRPETLLHLSAGQIKMLATDGLLNQEEMKWYGTRNYPTGEASKGD